jgi:hypothetical protein
MIVVECDKDQALMYRMSFVPDQVEHELGRSRVLAKVEKRQKAIGIIDEDPQSRRPEYLEAYSEKNTSGKIRLLVREDDNEKWIIQISPRLEDWLCGIAKRNKILPEEFDLPTSPGELHRMSLKVGKNRENFHRFLDALRRTKDNEIVTLREWIRQAIG